MSDTNTYLIAAVVAAFIVLMVDFDSANARWCEVYPELCTPDQTEITRKDHE